MFISIPALLLFACCLCVVFVSSAWGAEDFDFTYDMRNMIQMNPDFSTYSSQGGRGPDGVIWLKKVEIGMAPDGGVERQTMWILLGRRGLPSKWLSWNVPVPKGGKAEFLEARVLDNETGELAAATGVNEAGVQRAETPGMCSVSFSDLPEEFILVVHYREVFPERLSVDDLVWTSESLPVWETAIRVTVPAGHPFYHFSSQGYAPQEQNIDSRMIYEWRVLNTAAEISPSIRVTGRDCVVFGSLGDRSDFARFLRAIEGARVPAAPAAVRDIFGRRGVGAAEDVLGWLYKQPEIVLTNELREIPAEAPWTNREKMLLAKSWLQDAGVRARLFWRLPYSPGEGKPACEAAITNPVLEISQEDSEITYYDMERNLQGEGNKALWGGVAYGLAGGAGSSLEERRPVSRKAAENRLSASFSLSMNEDGFVTGTVNITARNAWRRILFPENPTSGDLDGLMRSMFNQPPRYSGLTFKESKTASELTASLSGAQAIKGTDGGHIMASLPPFVPAWLQNLASGPFPYDLLFPFLMDVKITMTLPRSTANALLPSALPPGAGKVRYSESYKLDKRKRFFAEARIVTDTTFIADDEAAGLSAAVQNWQAFMAKYLPVQLKGHGSLSR